MESRYSTREVSKQINWIDFHLEWFRNQNNISIYTSFGRDHPMALINGYDGMVHHEPFQQSCSCPIRDQALGWSPLRCIIKRLRSPPLDRDLTIRMLPAWFNRDCYNSPIYATCIWLILWSTSPRDPRATIVDCLIQRSSFSHVSCDLKPCGT